jgi:hypothetical protein
VHYMNLPYPMDCSFLLSLSGCINMLLYIGTLLLSLQYRGDFGLIADAEETVAVKPLLHGRGPAARAAGGGGAGAEVSLARDALFIPARDLGLLFSSAGSVLGGYGVTGYGKAHNLKVDLKDV